MLCCGRAEVQGVGPRVDSSADPGWKVLVPLSCGQGGQFNRRGVPPLPSRRKPDLTLALDRADVATQGGHSIADLLKLEDRGCRSVDIAKGNLLCSMSCDSSTTFVVYFRSLIGRHTFWLGSDFATAAGLAEVAALSSSGPAGAGGAGLGGPLRAGTPPLSEGMRPVSNQ